MTVSLYLYWENDADVTLSFWAKSETYLETGGDENGKKKYLTCTEFTIFLNKKIKKEQPKFLGELGGPVDRMADEKVVDLSSNSYCQQRLQK